MTNITKKECPIHGITDFYIFKKSNTNTFYHKCKKCNVINVDNKRKKIKIESIKYKGGKCEICGYNKCNAALEFHHLDPNEKDFGIASKGYTRSWEKIKAELDKCIIVCANCHREIHENIL